MCRQIILLALAYYLIAAGTSASGEGTFQFIQYIPETTNGSGHAEQVLAIMELSGNAPYSHAEVLSLTFTDKAESLLGYIGPYGGDLDITVGPNRVIENDHNVLGSTAFDGGGIGTLFQDNLPPVDPANSTGNPIYTVIGKPARLSMQFFGTRDSFSYITNGVEKLTVTGRWVRVIPEPTTFLLAINATVAAIVFRRCRSHGVTGATL